MPNSDNQDGVHNKKTDIYTRGANDDGGTYSSVDEAKAHLFSAAALTVIDECCTQVQYELVDNKTLKMTYAFGTKGTGTAEADDWTNQFATRSKALWDERRGPFNITAMTFNHASDANDEATVTAPGHTFVAGDRVLFDSVGGFTGTWQEGNINDLPVCKIVSVSGDQFTTEGTQNTSAVGPMTYTSGGTVQAADNSWQNHGSTWVESEDHLF